MKKFITAAALVAVIASPAFAQMFARAPARHHVQQHSSNPAYHAYHSRNPAYDVYDDRGQYVGSDPDPLVRDQLAHDPSQGGN
jgi:hypothetical protein